MSTINVHDLKLQGPGVLAALPAGELMTISDGESPVALVIGLDHPPKSLSRPLGLYAGQITIAEDFDAPLPEWEAAMEQPLA